MMSKEPTIIEVDMNELKDLLHRAEAALDEKDYAKIKAIIESYNYIAGLVGQKNITIARLRKMLFGAKTEKTTTVTGSGTEPEAAAAPEEDATASEEDAAADSSEQPDAEPAPENGSPARGKGHGRNGADAYTGAEQILVPHDSLQPGDACPDCGEGTVYEMARPGVLVRITGQAPVSAKVYRLQKLRCHLCGKIFTAQAPKGVGGRKYDAAAGSMIALLKYGSGMPFNRFAGLQGDLGIPLPASTQWDIVRDRAQRIQPAHAELIRQAAGGDIVYNDDTTVKILELMGKRAQQGTLMEGPVGDGTQKQRKGLFTSGIVSTREGRRIALFFSGRKPAELGPPIQMCDALSRNLPAELETMVANCLAHGRRQFVEVAEHFPEPCRQVLQSLAVIYRNDAIARKRDRAVRRWRNFTPGSPGSWKTGWSSPTRRWAVRSRTC